MLYLLLLILFFILAMILSFIKTNRRIDALEERISKDYAPIIGDIHRRLEILEQEEKLKR